MLLMPLFLTCQLCLAEDNVRLTIKQIKKAADQELKRQGYEPKKMNASYSENNSHWYIPILINGVKEQPNLNAKIEGHDYIVVLYSRKFKKRISIKGGDAYVFVDRNTGEILLLLSGK